MTSLDSLPRSIAIAGGWGYIGRKFLDAAKQLRLEAYVYDPGETPADLDIDSLQHVAGERQFCRLPADLFHLAVHPEHRRTAVELLLERSRAERVVVLNEKPMTAPETPERCLEIVQATGQTGIVMLYDFPELYDPLTARLLEFLRGFDRVQIEGIELCRSKDREDRANPRNQKRMVTIQYQETVHCLAFVLYLLGKLKGSWEAVLADGLSVQGRAQPYDPPNPEAYPHVVDGRCDYSLRLGRIDIQGVTNFKAGAPWAKTRVIRGAGDGKPFVVEADYLEGEKRLIINGIDQHWERGSNSYEHVIRTCWRWQQMPHQTLKFGVYPTPRFAQATYQLSSALWRSCFDDRRLQLPSLESLLAFDAGYREAVPGFERYPV